MKSTILQGCCLTELQKLPSDSVDCVVTSPPYWGLRDYGVPPTAWPDCSYFPMPGDTVPREIPAESSCLGLEKKLDAFIAHLVLIFEEVRRVLKPSGTCWVNMGDGYAGSWGSQGREYEGLGMAPLYARKVAASARKESKTGSIDQYPGLKPKDLQGQPWRLAFALQAAGWYLRSDIIWHKPNPMPESTQDRATKSHEYFFMLTKSKSYYFDIEAWKEKTEHSPDSPRNRWDTKDYLIPGQRPQKRLTRKTPDGWDTSKGSHGSFHKNGREKGRAVPSPRHDHLETNHVNLDEAGRDGFRNKRSVWTIATQPYTEAHYATYPPELIRPCIRAGCPPPRRCPRSLRWLWNHCPGSPRRRPKCHPHRSRPAQRGPDRKTSFQLHPWPPHLMNFRSQLTQEQYDKELFWRTAPADPVALAKKAGVPHYNRALGRALMPQSHMPIGAHAGKIMAEVPADYLAWVQAQPWAADWPAWAPITDYLTRHPHTTDNTAWPNQVIFVSPLIAVAPTPEWRWDSYSQLTALRDHEDKLHAFAVGALAMSHRWALPATRELPLHYRLSPARRIKAIALGAYELQPGLKARTQHFERLRESGDCNCTKHAYPDETEANRVASARLNGPRRNRPDYLRAYECPDCGFWHLTKQRPS